jgi:hypothetical protein
MNTAKLLAILCLALVAAPVMTGCFPGGPLIGGSGRTVTKSLDLAGFNAVDVSNAIRVNIKQGEAFSVSVTADDNLWDRLQLRTSGQTLQVGLQPGAYNNTHISAEITMPALSKLSLSGASQGNISGFKSGSGLNLDLSGAIRASGDAQAGAANFSLSGASNVSLSGAADSLVLDSSGASKAELTDFALDKANVTLSGASNTHLSVKSNLDYELSGAAHLTYSGDVFGPTEDRQEQHIWRLERSEQIGFPSERPARRDQVSG